MLINPFKKVPRIESDGKLVQHRFVFFAKGFSAMVFLLIEDVPNDGINLRVRVRKCPKPFLPGKLAVRPDFSVDEVGGISFDIPYQIRKGRVGFHADEEVRMVGHGVDGDKLVSLVLDNPGHVFVKPLFPYGRNQRITVSGGKDNVNMDLRVGVWHLGSTPTELDDACWNS